MLRILVVLAVLFGGLVAVSPPQRVADSHPGGTDENGCHTCRTNCTESWGIPYGYYHRHYPVRPCFTSTALPPPPPPPPPSLVAASPISAAQACSTRLPGRMIVSFRWTHPLLTGNSQWIDLSLFNNGFAFGTFIGAGPLSGSTEAFVWDGLLQGALHYYRINTEAFGGWHPSATYSFRTPIC